MFHDLTPSFANIIKISTVQSVSRPTNRCSFTRMQDILSGRQVLLPADAFDVVQEVAYAICLRTCRGVQEYLRYTSLTQALRYPYTLCKMENVSSWDGINYVLKIFCESFYCLILVYITAKYMNNER